MAVESRVVAVRMSGMARGGLEAGVKLQGELTRIVVETMVRSGKGGQGYGSSSYSGGGGGGYYGGAGGYGYSWVNPTGVWSEYVSYGGGGSGFLGSGLSNGCMYSYNTSFTSNTVTTKTVSTSNVSETATAGYAKRGNGFAKITLVD